MRGNEAAPRTLVWGIKDSLIRYVRGMSDGSVQVSGSAIETAEGFRFPPDPEPDPGPGSHGAPLRFRGAVVLTGHSGMLRICFSDPWLIPGPSPYDPWSITMSDPFEAGKRLVFAKIDRVDHDDSGALKCSGTRLTETGSDLFFAGPYTPGTKLDDPAVGRAAR